MNFIQSYMDEVRRVTEELDENDMANLVAEMVALKARGGRLFVLGVGGSAASGSHFVNDLRKIVEIEAYTPIDNVAELTARTNDEGWESVFAAWLKGSRLRAEDAIFVLSVGGGSLEHNVSPNLVRAIQLAREVGASVLGIVGRDGGYTAKNSDACVIVPVVNTDHVTPHTESFHSVVGHMLVSHPDLKCVQTKWESTAPASAS